MKRKTGIGRLFTLGACALMAAVTAVGAYASNYPNTVTFSNLSGNNAVVKLIGPLKTNVGVANGAQATVNVPAGTYYFLVRYCNESGQCRYSQGDPFEVVQSQTQYSVITITLHPVSNGNYHERPASRDDFDRN
jgi:hypothetical protein